MFSDVTRENTHKVKNILRMLRPYRLLGTTKIRVGRQFDGGYAMVDIFDGVEAAYSLGINDDVSWDWEIANRGVPIFQYDHTIDRLPVEHELFHWKRVGLSNVEDADNHLQTFANLVRDNGHESASNMLLKCDIEGAEWGVLSETPGPILNKFSQIVLELHSFHNLIDDSFADQVRRAVANLTANHRLVHVHANNFAPMTTIGGVTFPSVLEATFVRKDMGEFVASDEVFPTTLDMPCYSGAADLYLGRFTFD